MTTPATVEAAARGADAAFLLWPWFSADGAGPVVDALAAQVSRIVYLSASNVRDDRAPDTAGLGRLVEHPEQVSDAVPAVLGRPALSFADWAAEHSDDFRVLPTAEVDR